jgi:F-type H+-transporting ATPase subunit a
MAQPEEHAAHGTDHAEEGYNAGEVIINHVANSSLDHPIVHLPSIAGIDLSVTKHVFMLWVVAAIVFVTVTLATRRHLKQDRQVPTGFINAVEWLVQAMRDSIVLPNVGAKYATTWTPLILTFFCFIVVANGIGLVPIFEVIGLIDHTVLHSGEHSFLQRIIHGGATATANYNVTAGLATITFFAIIIAGTKAHGFIQHWKNLVPSGLPAFVYVILIPIELIGMLVKPFALTMRLAANMMGGHIAILAILSFVFLFNELFQSALVGMGVGVVLWSPSPWGSRRWRLSSSWSRHTYSPCSLPSSSAWQSTYITNTRHTEVT